jgi:nucleotide-binding universal stress UspA family protein
MEQDHPAGNRQPEYVFAPMQGRLGRGNLRLSFNYFGPLMRTISRILAATDFSSAGHAALARAGQLAAQHTAELHVVHATPDWNLFSSRSPMPQQHYDDISRNAEALLKKETTWLATEFAIHVAGQIHRGKASQAIVRAVGQYQPNLLVIGAHGEHAPQMTPTALGATTVKLTTQVKVPLLLVREAATKRYGTCLAAVGTSTQQGQRIVHWANVLAAGGDCHVVRAYEVAYLERLKLCGVSAQAMSACSQDAELAARYAASPPWLKEEGGAQMHMHLVRGRPVTSVLSEIDRLAPQFVAVGRHEEAPLAAEHPLMGCVGMQIAYHCPVDVLIVP